MRAAFSKPLLRAIALAVLLPLALAPSAGGAQVVDGVLPRATGDALWADLGRAPYARSGSHGLVVYMLSFSTCPYCIAFMNTVYRPRRASIELREIFVPMADRRLEAQAVDVGMTRDPALVDAFYRHDRTAPPIATPQQRAIERRLTTVVGTELTLLREAGIEPFGYPTFVVRVGDGAAARVWIDFGMHPSFVRRLDGWIAGARAS